MQRLLGEGFPLGVHHRFEVVQQHHHRFPRREGVQHGQHHLRRAVARVLVDALQPLRIIRWQQTQQARDQGRVLHLVHPVAAQVHDPARRDLGQVAFHIRDPAGLQPFEQPANHRRLADPAAPSHAHQPDPRVGHVFGQQARLHPPALEPGRSHRRRRVDELRRPHRLRLSRGLLALDPAADPPPRVGQVPQRAFHQLPQRGRVRERARGQPAILHTAAERVLPVPELAIDQRRQRDTHLLSSGVQQEHQPVQVCLGRGIELQLRMGHLWLIPYRGAIPGAQHPHIHLAPPHPLRAHSRGWPIGRGEVGHVRDDVPGRGDRPLHRGHIRPPPREVPQLGGVRDEHPPPGTITGTI